MSQKGEFEYMFMYSILYRTKTFNTNPVFYVCKIHTTSLLSEMIAIIMEYILKTNSCNIERGEEEERGISSVSFLKC